MKGFFAVVCTVLSVVCFGLASTSWKGGIFCQAKDPIGIVASSAAILPEDLPEAQASVTVPVNSPETIASAAPFSENEFVGSFTREVLMAEKPPKDALSEDSSFIVYKEVDGKSNPEFPGFAETIIRSIEENDCWTNAIHVDMYRRFWVFDTKILGAENDIEKVLADLSAKCGGSEDDYD